MEYTIKYDDGYASCYTSMQDSFFVYGYYDGQSGTIDFEGTEVTPDTKLRKNTFTYNGYQFIGWNTEKDGTGISVSDEMAFMESNLSTWEQIFNSQRASLYNCDETPKITLYAQWKKVESNLLINANGGKVHGSSSYTYTKKYRETLDLDSITVTPKAGYKVSFNGNGSGTPEKSSITSTMKLTGWIYTKDSRGSDGIFDPTTNIYTFKGPQLSPNVTDTVTAQYESNFITLPGATPSGDGYFIGWYKDPQCTEYVGGKGDPYTPSGDTTLHAGFSTLSLTAYANYTANSGKGAVDLYWTQTGGVSGNFYKLYQSCEKVLSASNKGTEVSKIIDSDVDKKITKTYGYSGGTGYTQSCDVFLEEGDVIMIYSFNKSLHFNRQ